jgi:predicted dinucleotide-binding enzyme
MKVGIIGSGNIGATAARPFVAAGYEVAIGNRSGPPSLDRLADELGTSLRPGTVDEVAGFGDAVVLAIPFASYETLTGDAFSGQIVIDATNYYPGPDYHLSELDDHSATSTELLAAHLGTPRSVKAFNTMAYTTLASGGDRTKSLDDRLALFVAGDDAEAKKLAISIIDELGFAPIDTGGLAAGGRRQQPGSPLYNAGLTGAQARAALANNG